MADSTQPGARNSHRSVQKILAAISAAEVGSGPLGRIEVIETHFAWVLLVGAFAYKLKKAVATHGFDLRALDARRYSCEQELQLNQALAPGVYLEVVPVLQGARGSLRLHGEGEAVEWLLKMQRLDRASMLDRAMANGAVSRSQVSTLAHRLAVFYRSQPAALPPQADYVQRIALQIDANLTELTSPDLALERGQVEAVMTVQRAALDEVADELRVRHALGRIVEAHGDLRPEHIHLGPPPCVIDRLEFSADLRTLDPCEELAFLHVECSRADHEWIADLVLQTYLETAGDEVSAALMRFYASHRAAMRAKVTAWHLRDPAVRDNAPWAQQAKEYLRLAKMYLRHY